MGTTLTPRFLSAAGNPSLMRRAMALISVCASHAAAGPVRLPHVSLEPRDLETSRQDAHDLGREAVEHEARAERIARASESRLPEAMADQDRPLTLVGLFGRKAAPQDGLD